MRPIFYFEILPDKNLLPIKTDNNMILYEITSTRGPNDIEVVYRYAQVINGKTTGVFLENEIFKLDLTWLLNIAKQFGRFR